MRVSGKWIGYLAGLVLAVALLVTPGPASATTYYVNAAAGDDLSNDGLTPGEAWGASPMPRPLSRPVLPAHQT